MEPLISFGQARDLDSREAVAGCLSRVLAGGRPEAFLAALSLIVQARGLNQVARAAGLDPDSLFKALSPGGRPELGTLLKVMGALGVQLVAQPLLRN